MLAGIRQAEPQAGVGTSGSSEGAAARLDGEDVPFKVRELCGISTSRTSCAIALDWATIVACFACSLSFPHIVVWLAAALIIATRQHALLILMHDAAHHRLFPHRAWNDRVSNWLLAWPLLVSTEGYRNNHLAHHLHLNTDRDPDWTRKNGKPDWTFPKSKVDFVRLLVRELFGGGFVEALRSISDLSGNKLRDAKKGSPRIERIAFYVVAASLITAAEMWVPVLMLWFLPAFTLLPVILRIRSIAEHFAVEGDDELNTSRNTHGALWERLVLLPHNCGYHLDHHLYPAVPFYNLPKLHTRLKADSAYRSRAHQSHTVAGSDKTSLVNEISQGA